MYATCSSLYVLFFFRSRHYSLSSHQNQEGSHSACLIPTITCAHTSLCPDYCVTMSVWPIIGVNTIMTIHSWVMTSLKVSLHFLFCFVFTTCFPIAMWFSFSVFYILNPDSPLNTSPSCGNLLLSGPNTSGMLLGPSSQRFSLLESHSEGSGAL